MSIYKEFDFFEFQEKFQAEEDCFTHLKNLRWPDGFTCPVCGYNESFFMKKRKVFQCAKCRHQTSVTAHTIFHRTHTPLKKWFWAVYVVGTDNDSYFGTATSGKRGRGSSNKSKVVVAVENKGKHAGYAAMHVVEHIDFQHIKDFALRNIERQQSIKTDAYPSYNILDVEFYHQGEIVKPHEALEKLPWVHILIGNVKSFISGTYHGVSHKHLQCYLNEFCYRFNRRFNENQLLDRILTACLFTPTFTYAELTL